MGYLQINPTPQTVLPIGPKVISIVLISPISGEISYQLILFPLFSNIKWSIIPFRVCATRHTSFQGKKHKVP